MTTRITTLLLLVSLLAPSVEAQRRRIEDNPARSPATPSESDLLWAKKAPYGAGDDFRLPLGDILLSLLGDVDFSSGAPVNGDVLTYDGTSWIPVPISGDTALDGDYGDFTCVTDTCNLDADVVTATEAADLWVFVAGDTGLGTMTWGSAAGPAIADEASSDTNPTLIPNRASMDDGIGHNGSNPVMIEAGIHVASWVSGRFDVGPSTGGGTSLRLRDRGPLEFQEDSTNGVNLLSLVPPASVVTDRTCNLTNAVNFIPDTCVAPPGSTTQVVFNDGGVSAGDAGMVYDKTNNWLSLNSAVSGTSLVFGMNHTADHADSDVAVLLNPPPLGTAIIRVDDGASRAGIEFTPGDSIEFKTGSGLTTIATIASVFALVPLASAPATCAIGDFYVDTSGASCGCSATNTWSNLHATGTCV